MCTCMQMIIVKSKRYVEKDMNVHVYFDNVLKLSKNF